MSDGSTSSPAASSSAPPGRSSRRDPGAGRCTGCCGSIRVRSASRTAKGASADAGCWASLPSLAAGELVIARADGALTITAGQARVSNVIAHGEGADLTLSGTLELASRALDARLTLSGPADGGAPGTARPELFVTLQGPATAPQRSIDVSALVDWLMLRSLDRETRRMEAVEADKHDPAAAPAHGPSVTAPTEPEPPVQAAPSQGASPSPLPGQPRLPETAAAPVGQAPSLPPPVEIRPTPGPVPIPGRAARPKDGAPMPARPLAREGTVSPAPKNRSIFDRLFGTHD